MCAGKIRDSFCNMSITLYTQTDAVIATSTTCKIARKSVQHRLEAWLARALKRVVKSSSAEHVRK